MQDSKSEHSTTHGEMHGLKLSTSRITVYAIILVVIACVFAVYLRLFTGKELWYEMFAAILGVIITAVITVLLLNGQTNTEEKRDRNSKIFEEKLKIYQEFLHTLCRIVKDGKLTKEEKVVLEFQTSYAMMHCEQTGIACLGDAMKKLVDAVWPVDRDKTNREKDLLFDALFDIVEVFRKDLYGDDFHFDYNNRKNTLDTFTEAFREAGSDSVKKTANSRRLTVDVNILSNALSQAPVTSETTAEQLQESPWETAKLKWEKAGWEIQNEQNGEKIGLEKVNWVELRNMSMRNIEGENVEAVVDFGFYYGGHFCARGRYGHETDFTMPMKWEYGGDRPHGQWRHPLEDPYYDLTEGEFTQKFVTDWELQRQVVYWMDLIIQRLTEYHRTRCWQDALLREGLASSWKISVSYWTTLCCKCACDEDLSIALSVFPGEENDSGGEKKICFMLSYESGSIEKFRALLQRWNLESGLSEDNM